MGIVDEVKILKKLDDYPEEKKNLQILYSTLPFASKEDIFWTYTTPNPLSKENNLPNNIFFWVSLLGINKLPDEGEFILIANTLKEDFGALNEQCVTEAIKMNFRGEFGSVSQAYNALNVKFLYDILLSYKKKCIEANKLALKFKQLMNVPKELTPAEIEQEMKLNVISIFKERKSKNIVSTMEGISYPIYDYLVKHGLIKGSTFNKIEWEEIKKKGNDYFLKNKTTKINSLISEIINPDDEKKQINNCCKQMTVLYYFNSIDKLEL